MPTGTRPSSQQHFWAQSHQPKKFGMVKPLMYKRQVPQPNTVNQQPAAPHHSIPAKSLKTALGPLCLIVEDV